MVLAVAYVCWGLFLFAWTLGALYNAFAAPKAARGSGNPLAGFGLRVAAVVGLIWLMGHSAPTSMWGLITFTNQDLAILGLVILVPSTLLALWARWELGKMWSATPMVKEHHELRTSGPYGLTRHPIYTAILGMLLGSACVMGSGLVLLGLGMSIAVLALRVRHEEKLMTQTFGEQYLRYKRRVPQLLPFLRPHAPDPIPGEMRVPSNS